MADVPVLHRTSFARLVTLGAFLYGVGFAGGCGDDPGGDAATDGEDASDGSDGPDASEGGQGTEASSGGSDGSGEGTSGDAGSSTGESSDAGSDTTSGTTSGSTSGSGTSDGGDAVPVCVTDLVDAGTSSLCASCACGRCPEPVDACMNAAGAGVDACLAAVACQHDSGCVGAACYCGEGLDSVLCALNPVGPCVTEFETAAQANGWSAIEPLLAGSDPSNALYLAHRVGECTLGSMCPTQCGPAGEVCTFEDEACQDRYCTFDPARELERAASAASRDDVPLILEIYVNDELAWSEGESTRPLLRPGDRVRLAGLGFGAGPDIDFSKIMIGNARVLETDLRMYKQELDIISEVHHETPEVHSSWDKDIVAWQDDLIEFTVPKHVNSGPLRVQVQKRLGANASLVRPGEPHLVVDALTLRITDLTFAHRCDVVSKLTPPMASLPIDVDIDNPSFAALVAEGRKIFWGYDFNIGLTHAIRGLDWDAIFAGTAIDPMTGQAADPTELFGAVPTRADEVPDEAIEDVAFSLYPQPNPVPGFLLTPQVEGGTTYNTGYVGYRAADSSHPFNGPGKWIGFNCASCHGYSIRYERAPGEVVTRVFPGLPNPNWSMKWALLGEFEGIRGEEEGPLHDPGIAAIDKTPIVYAMPPGTGEHTTVRFHGEGSHTDNDYQFSPIAIPNVTKYMPIRRSLGHTESYVGFEGSYIHSEEPDGALGSMRAEALQALTAYMAQLDEKDDDLRNVGLHRWLAYRNDLADLVGDVTEGEFVQAGWQSFDGLVARVDAGKKTFDAYCGDCHHDALETHTDERMFRLDEVGRFFEPTLYQEHTQSTRVTFLRDLYWVQHRGLLTDGHVRNLEDLIHPDRCSEGSALYDRYYTLHPPEELEEAGPDFPPLQPGASPRGDVFRVVRSAETDEVGIQRNRFVERHAYFVEVPWDPDHYYWDYQRMRAEYGPRELGSAIPIGMPAAPHPWCVQDEQEMPDLLLYLLTL